MSVSKYILNQVPFEPKYEEIKDQIDVSQYVENKVSVKIKTFNKKLTITVALSILIFVVGLFFVVDNKFNIGKLSDSIENPNIKTTKLHSDVNVYFNDYDLISDFNYIFIGQVIEEAETKQYDGKGTPVPYTFYKIKEIQFMKGEKPEKEGLICFYGGMESKDLRVLCEFNDEILIEGQYYLFLMNKRKEDSSNARIGENDYVLARNDQKVLLDGYDENKSLLEQSKKIQYSINRVLNIVNKELNVDSFEMPTFDSKEELVDYYDYIAIIEISYSFPIMNLESIGEGSDIPANRYGFTRLYSYKELYYTASSYEGNVYAYSTNFWNDNSFENSIPVLEEGSCYLIFANKKDLNDQNTRIGDDDYVLYGVNQVVKIDQSIINELYGKNEEDVKMILESYFPVYNN